LLSRCLVANLIWLTLQLLNPQISESDSESEILYDWRFTANQFVLAKSPLRPTTKFFIFILNTCGYSPYVTSSLRKGWFFRLQFLLVLASAVILRSDSRRTRNHILLSQIRDSPNLEGQVPLFISPRNRVAQLYPQSLGSLFDGSYDSQGYVEVFDPASARDSFPPILTNARPFITVGEPNRNQPLRGFHSCSL
jgi:hypothetical protein